MNREREVCIYTCVYMYYNNDDHDNNNIIYYNIQHGCRQHAFVVECFHETCPEFVVDPSVHRPACPYSGMTILRIIIISSSSSSNVISIIINEFVVDPSLHRPA